MQREAVQGAVRTGRGRLFVLGLATFALVLAAGLFLPSHPLVRNAWWAILGQLAGS